MPGEASGSLDQRVAALERTLRQLESREEEEVADLPNPRTPLQIAIVEKPTHKLRGRIYTDGIMYDDDDDIVALFGTDRENEFGFDTVRLGVQGDIYENIRYMLEVEFEGTEVDFKDVFMEMHSMPVIGTVRAGHFKEPIGLEELTSSRFDTFMEQSYATLAFAPGRNYGVMIYNDLDPCQDATWFLGAFRHNSDDSPDAIATSSDDRNDWSLASRIAWLPYYDEPSDGRYLTHLGASYSYRNSIDDAEFETGAWVGNQPPIGVGAMAESDTWNQIGLEGAVVWGALSVQSEYFHAFVTSGENYHGAYIQVSYFLTGENRGYNKGAKAFDRVHPFEPAFWIDTCQGYCCGRGAWEIASGFSYVNLRDGEDIAPLDQERALVDGFIFGVNWYLNPYSRVMLNYNYEVTDFVDAGTPDSNANIFGVRWQVDW
jgi:phosphate-selective porin OprO/OprP